jgi:hypothetical protein
MFTLQVLETKFMFQFMPKAVGTMACSTMSATPTSVALHAPASPGQSAAPSFFITQQQ